MVGLTALAGLLSAAPAIYQGIQGAKQIAQGRIGLARLGDRPQYELPQEVLQMAAMARANVADPYMAGENRMLDQVNQSAANAFAQSKEAGNPLAMLGDINANTNQSTNQIGIQSAQQQMLDQQNLSQQLQNLANYKDQQWQMNTFAPYQQKYSENRDLIGAGNKNLYDALGDASTAAIQSFIKPAMAQQLLGSNPATIPTGNSAANQQQTLSDLLKTWGQRYAPQQQNVQQPQQPNTGAGSGLPNDYLGNLLKGMLGR